MLFFSVFFNFTLTLTVYSKNERNTEEQFFGHFKNRRAVFSKQCKTNKVIHLKLIVIFYYCFVFKMNFRIDEKITWEKLTILLPAPIALKNKSPSSGLSPWIYFIPVPRYCLFSRIVWSHLSLRKVNIMNLPVFIQRVACFIIIWNLSYCFRRINCAVSGIFC